MSVGGEIIGYNRPNAYTISIGASTYTPVDGSTFYFSGFHAGAPVGTDAYFAIRIPRNGMIRSASIRMKSVTATGTNEQIDMYVRINTTDTLIASVSLAADPRDFVNYSMNVPVVVDDILQIKVVCPTWATNPDGCRFSGHILVDTE